jgi:hypothetical protein
VRIPPPVIHLLHILLGALAERLVPLNFLPEAALAYLRGVGAVLGMGGLVLFGVASRQFQRAKVDIEARSGD